LITPPGPRFSVTIFTGAPYTSNHKIVQWPYMDLIKKKKLPFLPVFAELVLNDADQELPAGFNNAFGNTHGAPEFGPVREIQ
jgi:hypothetical protein